MPHLITSAAVLTVSRLSNFSIQLLSPLLLVRILDIQAYGEYQEFMIYAALFTTLCTFSIDSSLTYFLPLFPEREKSFASQTTAVTLVISALLLSTLLFGKSIFLKLASYDFVAPLCAYVFCFVNLDWLEYYWIAKRQPGLVLFYSASRLTLRIFVLLVVAYVTRNVMTILWSLVAVEASRVLLVLTYLARKGVFVADIRRSEVVLQLKFAVPIGSAALLQHVGRSIGKIFIGGTFGPAALAYYAVGSYLQPIVQVLRSGIADAVYPELVRAHAERGAALRLWQRVNVLNCAVFFPAFVIFIYYAEQIVTALFTTEYRPAIPVFCIYAAFLIRRCFNTDVLLRVAGRTGFMFWGTSGALAANVCVIVLFGKTIGIIGPAIAFIIAEVVLEFYFANRALRALELNVADLADWVGILRITASCIVGVPILIVASLLPGDEIVRVIVSSVIYMLTVIITAYRFGVVDIGHAAGLIRLRVFGAPRL